MQRRKTLLFLLALIGVLTLLRIQLQTTLDEENSVLGENTQALTALKIENLRLEDAILQAQALGTIKEKAEKAGFVPGTIYYIVGQH